MKDLIKYRDTKIVVLVMNVLGPVIIIDSRSLAKKLAWLACNGSSWAAGLLGLNLFPGWKNHVG